MKKFAILALSLLITISIFSCEKDALKESLSDNANHKQEINNDEKPHAKYSKELMVYNDTRDYYVKLKVSANSLKRLNEYLDNDFQVKFVFDGYDDLEHNDDYPIHNESEELSEDISFPKDPSNMEDFGKWINNTPDIIVREVIDSKMPSGARGYHIINTNSATLSSRNCNFIRRFVEHSPVPARPRVYAYNCNAIAAFYNGNPPSYLGYRTVPAGQSRRALNYTTSPSIIVHATSSAHYSHIFEVYVYPNR